MRSRVPRVFDGGVALREDDDDQKQAEEARGDAREPACSVRGGHGAEWSPRRRERECARGSASPGRLARDAAAETSEAREGSDERRTYNTEKKKGFPRRDVFESASRESDERASSYHTLYSLDYLKAARGRLCCF